jgi:hypothetical protein
LAELSETRAHSASLAALGQMLPPSLLKLTMMWAKPMILGTLVWCSSIVGGGFHLRAMW